MITIGKLSLKHGVFLAPMAGVTDYAYRCVCKAHGAEYMTTEMVSAKAMHFGDRNTGILAEVTENEQPMAVQIFGSEPEIMAEAAKMLSEMKIPPCAIDINMGCPAKKIVSNGEGSFLMKNPERAAEIVYAVSRATSLPVTVKIRAGYSESEKNAPLLAPLLEQAGASMITIHGRTREQMYAPPVDLEVIKAVKDAVKIPVIGNGDIFSSFDALEMKKKTGCDGVMLGRGTMGNPWLFEEVISAFEGKNDFVSPTPSERIAAAISHAELLIKNKQRTGVLEARRHISYYLKGIYGSAASRCALNTAEDFDTMKEILNRLLDSVQRHSESGEGESKENLEGGHGESEGGL